MDTKSTQEKFPKLLPWLAHKAGIGEQRAETLWRTALRHAATREHGSARDAAAMSRLLELIAEESRREDAASFGLRCWARLNASLWQAPVALYDALALNAARGWRVIGQSIRPC
jgi:FMN phosphatase YigB (HAD superfamily)